MSVLKGLISYAKRNWLWPALLTCGTYMHIRNLSIIIEVEAIQTITKSIANYHASRVDLHGWRMASEDLSCQNSGGETARCVDSRSSTTRVRWWLAERRLARLHITVELQPRRKRRGEAAGIAGQRRGTSSVLQVRQRRSHRRRWRARAGSEAASLGRGARGSASPFMGTRAGTSCPGRRRRSLTEVRSATRST
jgi:hypothetical protein